MWTYQKFDQIEVARAAGAVQGRVAFRAQDVEVAGR